MPVFPNQTNQMVFQNNNRLKEKPTKLSIQQMPALSETEKLIFFEFRGGPLLRKLHRGSTALFLYEKVDKTCSRGKFQMPIRKTEK